MATLNRTLSGLDPGKRYIVRIRAKNLLGVTSEWSESIAFEAQESSLDILEQDLVCTPGIRTIIVQWNSTDLDLLRYELHISTTPGFTPDVTTRFSSPVGGSLTVINAVWDGAEWVALEPNTTYYVQLYAISTDATPVTEQIGDEVEVMTASNDTTLEPVETFYADAIGTGTLTAGLTVSGVIQTGTSGSRVVIGTYQKNPDKIGLAAFDEDEEMVLEFDNSTGKLFVRGRIDAQYGPNLITNTDFEESVEGWSTDIGGRMWLFSPDSPTPTESWVRQAGPTFNISNTLDPDKILFGDDGSLMVVVTGGTLSSTIKVRSPNPSEDITFTAPTGPGTTHSAVARVYSPQGAKTARLVIRWYKDVFHGYAFISETHGDDFEINNTDDNWSELTINEAPSPAETAYASLQVEIDGTHAVNDEYYIAFAGLQLPNVAAASQVEYDTGEFGLMLESNAGLETAPQVGLVHTPPGTTWEGAIPVEEGEFYHVTLGFYIKQTLPTYLPASYTDAVIITMFMYDGNAGNFVSLDLGTGFSAPGYLPPTEAGAPDHVELTGMSEVFEIPIGVTHVRVGVAFVSTSVANDYMVIDDVQLRKSSIITSSILRAGESNQPRVEVKSASNPRISMFPSGRTDEYPAIIKASTDTLGIYSPHSAIGNVKSSGLRLLAGQTSGKTFPPLWAFDSSPVSFSVSKSGAQNFSNTTWTKMTVNQEAYDPMGMIPIGGDDKAVVPEGFGGIWLIQAGIEWTEVLWLGQRGIRIRIDNAAGAQQSVRLLQTTGNVGSWAEPPFTSGMAFVYIQEGYKFYVQGYHNAGGALQVESGFFGAVYLGGSSGT